MKTEEFIALLSQEVSSYKDLLETVDNQWIVKGFIDVNQRIYSITTDTKVISKIIEVILIPQLKSFAQYNGLSLQLPSSQNYYPDLTFIDSEGNLFAVDIKTSYYGDDNRINGLTLGSYWGYFRNRTSRKNVEYPYGAYKCHLVLGVLYKQCTEGLDECRAYVLDELSSIRSVIDNFIFFVQPKWRIASDTPGSGNTRNIGGIVEIDKLVNGRGVFAELGEEVFDDYWMNFYNVSDAGHAGLGVPRYKNLKSYREYLDKYCELRSKIDKR